MTGFGDRSAKVTEFAPINPLPDSVGAATALLDHDPVSSSQLAGLLSLVDGFETPYSLELLATVHFASTREPATGDPSQLTGRVAAWSLRKASMFTDKHVRVAATRLAESGLLPA